MQNFLLIKSPAEPFMALFSSGGCNLPGAVFYPTFPAVGLLLSAPAGVPVCRVDDTRKAGKIVLQKFVCCSCSAPSLSLRVPENINSSSGVNKLSVFGILLLT